MQLNTNFSPGWWCIFIYLYKLKTDTFSYRNLLGNFNSENWHNSGKHGGSNFGEKNKESLTHTWRRKWQLTPVLLPGDYHGQRSLTGYSPWARRVGQDWMTSLSLSFFTSYYIKESILNDLRKYFRILFMNIFIILSAHKAILSKETKNNTYCRV